MGGMAWSSACWCILTTYRRQNWLDFGHGLLTFLISAPFILSKGQVWGFQPFSEERMRGTAWNLACLCIFTTCRSDRFWLRSVYLLHFGTILTKWNKSGFIYTNFISSVRPERFPGIFFRTHGRNGLKFAVHADVSWLPSDIQDWLDCCLLIFHGGWMLVQ